jgi:rfaE bifunctional protein nucleotidyltransferase chain/domain
MVTRPESRIFSRAALLERFARPRAGRLVFTCGVFDILHRGHVEHLFAARALGDVLVVGVHSDGSTRRLKGEGRPAVPLPDRLYVLAGLGCVDAVTSFSEETPLELITQLRPDVLVRAGQLAPHEVIGADAVRQDGGEVIVLPAVQGRSSSKVIKRMQYRV